MPDLPNWVLQLGLGGLALWLLGRLVDRIITAHLKALDSFVRTQDDISKTQGLLQGNQERMTQVLSRLADDIEQHLEDDKKSDTEILTEIRKLQNGIFVPKP